MNKVLIALACVLAAPVLGAGELHAQVHGMGLNVGSRGILKRPIPEGGMYPWSPYSPYYGHNPYSRGFYSHRYPFDPIHYADPRGTYYFPPGATVPQATNIGYFTIIVPVAAQVWCDGQQMLESGVRREFQSPPLEPGYEYTMSVRAVWEQNGMKLDQTRTVNFQPGQNVTVDFTRGSRP